VHADEPDHVLLARWDRVGSDVEGVVPVVRVLPEATFALLQEHSMVESEVAGDSREVGCLGSHEQVVDPLVSVAHFEEDAEAEGMVDALVDFGLGVRGDQTALEHEGMDELHLGQVVVSIDSVFRRGFELDSLQLLFQTFILLVR